jgi:lipid-A-disaccharide synthase
VALMPGSRRGELKKHLPVIAAAARRIAAEVDVKFRVLLPNSEFVALAEAAFGGVPNCTIQIGGAGRLLRSAAVALSKTGTITLECALCGLPTVTFYQTSPLTYFIGRRVVTVPYLTMPNLLAKEAVFPEFVQDDASPENLAGAVLELLRDEKRRAAVKTKLAKLVATLGEPGAPDRAAEAVIGLMT